MTAQTPIERATPALFETLMGTDEIEPVEVRMAMLTRTDRDTFREGARAVFASIDTDQLANHIRTIDGDHTMGTGALAEHIKNWLTGKDQQ